MKTKSVLRNSVKLFCILAVLMTVSCLGPKDGDYTFKVLSTNDVHGRYFDQPYVGEGVRNSLMSACWYADSVRTANGSDNVILLDVGDFLQGDNAAYYYNFVDTSSEHLYARMSEYMATMLWLLVTMMWRLVMPYMTGWRSSFLCRSLLQMPCVRIP